jgi:hypothetical protein
MCLGGTVERSGGNRGNRGNGDGRALASAYVLRSPALAPCISECESKRSGDSDKIKE